MADDSAPTTPQFPSAELEAVLNYYSSSVGSVLCLPSNYQKDDFDDDGGHAYIFVVLAVQNVLGKLVAREAAVLKFNFSIMRTILDSYFRSGSISVFRLV